MEVPHAPNNLDLAILVDNFFVGSNGSFWGTMEIKPFWLKPVNICFVKWQKSDSKLISLTKYFFIHKTIIAHLQKMPYQKLR